VGPRLGSSSTRLRAGLRLQAADFRLQMSERELHDLASPSTGFIPVEATTGSYPADPPPSLSLSAGFIPVGATTGSYMPRPTSLDPFAWGFAPSGEWEWSVLVAANRGSAGTRPAMVRKMP
ncbi:MAG: hypothetical protein ACK52S_04960, partial [Pirellula sp.]